jgi:hypothetical protein
MDLLVLKIIADFILIAVIAIFGIFFLIYMKKIENSVSHIAGEFMVLTTHTQPDTLREVVDKAIFGGPTFLEEAILQDETCYGGGIPRVPVQVGRRIRPHSCRVWVGIR